MGFSLTRSAHLWAQIAKYSSRNSSSFFMVFHLPSSGFSAWRLYFIYGQRSRSIPPGISPASSFFSPPRRCLSLSVHRIPPGLEIVKYYNSSIFHIKKICKNPPPAARWGGDEGFSQRSDLYSIITNKSLLSLPGAKPWDRRTFGACTKFFWILLPGGKRITSGFGGAAPRPYGGDSETPPWGRSTERRPRWAPPRTGSRGPESPAVPAGPRGR